MCQGPESSLTHNHTQTTTPQMWIMSPESNGLDTEAGMLSGISRKRSLRSSPYGSRNSAIHNAYHSSLRPSSLFEPRHPSLKVVFDARGGQPPRARHRYICISTHNGSFTVKEDGPMLIHYPRTSARGSRCYPHPRT